MSSERTITLDHVTPRRGQTAYDRRDNLVLACKRCNAAKGDKPFLVFLIANRTRAAFLLRYGSHLSTGIVELVAQIGGQPVPQPAAPAAPKRQRVRYGNDGDDASPYRDSPSSDSPYRMSA